MVWASLDKWRHNPAFKPRFNTLFPGLALSAGIVTAYACLQLVSSGPNSALLEPEDPVIGFRMLRVHDAEEELNESSEQELENWQKYMQPVRRSDIIKKSFMKEHQEE